MFENYKKKRILCIPELNLLCSCISLFSNCSRRVERKIKNNNLDDNLISEQRFSSMSRSIKFRLSLGTKTLDTFVLSLKLKIDFDDNEKVHKR